jgi:hypothetical protein
LISINRLRGEESRNLLSGYVYRLSDPVRSFE